ncbi:flagellar export chaperone FliS [Gynuella sp.]|uniref:flagellar export chaperone FliS n=1 Tax=Gynuella sp. TaxID=2969146 RepID=UPI003D0DA63D
MYSSGANHYQAVSNQTSIVDADPHQLIQLLLEGAMSRMAQARGCIERGDIEGRNNSINKAIAIIGGLNSSLNMDAGEISFNLKRLYEYMQQRLFEANVRNDMDALDEVVRLLGEIKVAWEGIKEEAKTFIQSR